MPIHVYKCESCGHEEEVLVPREEPPENCPQTRTGHDGDTPFQEACAGHMQRVEIPRNQNGDGFVLVGKWFKTGGY